MQRELELSQLTSAALPRLRLDSCQREGGRGVAIAICMQHKRQLTTVSTHRVTHQVADLGWVDFDSGCSTVGLILLGPIRDR